MEIINRIDKLIAQLNSLKPELSDDLSGNEKKFSDLLKSSVELSSEISYPSVEPENFHNKMASNVTPDWVDKNYEYNIQNPRKPNMRELMEAISEKSIDELYSEPEESWRKINDQAAELLYGVVGSNIDTRDWATIMSSGNILKSLKEQTGIMYEPTLDILSSFDENNNLTWMGTGMAPGAGYSGYATSTTLTFNTTKRVIPTCVMFGLDLGSGFTPNELHIQDVNAGVNTAINSYTTTIRGVSPVIAAAEKTQYNVLCFGYTADAEL